MDQSRDDFVIAIRSAFLKKGNKQRFSLLSLIIFSIIFLVLGNFNFKIINFNKVNLRKSLTISLALFVVSVYFFDYNFTYTGGGIFFKISYYIFKNNILNNHQFFHQQKSLL